MLAAFTAAVFAFSPPVPTFTVEFRVLRVPAGRGEHLIHFTDGLGVGGSSAIRRRQGVIWGEWLPPALVEGSSPVDVGGAPHSSRFAPWVRQELNNDSLIDAGGLPGHDVNPGGFPSHDSRYIPQTRKAELSGPKLRAGRTPTKTRLTLPLWAVVTSNEEWTSPFAREAIRTVSQEVLVAHTTFTASAVPTVDGRIELRVSYIEGELPPEKESALPLSPDLAPFYASDAPAPQPIASTFWLPSVVNRTTDATANATLMPGQALVFFVGRSTSRSTQPWLANRALDVFRWWQATEDDVIVFATVRK